MFIAHLPSGFILARLLERSTRMREGARASRHVILPAALAGAVFPDLDLFYFYFVDLGRTHHHMFFPHWPLAWLALGVPVILLAHFANWPAIRNGAVAFFLAVMLHCILDSVAAPIFWLMPFAEGRVELVRVPANYSHVVISFLLHWTFLLELAIWFVAIAIYWRTPTRRNHPASVPGTNKIN